MMDVYRGSKEDEPYDAIHKMVAVADRRNQDMIGRIAGRSIIVHPGNDPVAVFEKYFGEGGDEDHGS